MSLPVYFAPLQGCTESAYRRAHAAVCGGVERYFTPFLRWEHREVRKKELRDIGVATDNGTQFIVPQVIARNAEEFEQLVNAVLLRGYKTIDLNMGCPFPMQTGKGRGAGLIQHPEQLKGILDRMARYRDEQDVRFSVKMRLGQELAEEGLRILPMLNETPIEWLTLHCRVGKQQYKGEVDMAGFERFYAECSKPMVYNGDLQTVEDICRIEALFPRLQAVMIGRGLLSRPTLATEYTTGVKLTDEDVRERVFLMYEQIEADYRLTLEGGDAQVKQKMLPLWEYMESLFGHKFVKDKRKLR